MQTISLDKMPDELVERLKRLATERGSEISVEAMRCLESGLTQQEQVEITLKSLRELRAKMKGVWLTEEHIRAARNERRE